MFILLYIIWHWEGARRFFGSSPSNLIGALSDIWSLVTLHGAGCPTDCCECYIDQIMDMTDSGWCNISWWISKGSPIVVHINIANIAAITFSGRKSCHGYQCSALFYMDICYAVFCVAEWKRHNSFSLYEYQLLWKTMAQFGMWKPGPILLRLVQKRKKRSRAWLTNAKMMM